VLRKKEWCFQESRSGEKQFNAHENVLTGTEEEKKGSSGPKAGRKKDKKKGRRDDESEFELHWGKPGRKKKGCFRFPTFGEKGRSARNRHWERGRQERKSTHGVPSSPGTKGQEKNACIDAVKKKEVVRAKLTEERKKKADLPARRQRAREVLIRPPGKKGKTSQLIAREDARRNIGLCLPDRRRRKKVCPPSEGGKRK